MTEQTAAPVDSETAEALAVTRNSKGQFVLGQSGNPAGRPKGRSALTKALTEVAEGFYPSEVDQALAEDRDPRTRAEILAEVLFQKAIKGDVAAATLIFSRVEGKPKAQVEVKGKVDVGGEVKHTPTRVAVLEGLAALRTNLSVNEAKILKEPDIVEGEIVEPDDEDPGFTQ